LLRLNAGKRDRSPEGTAMLAAWNREHIAYAGRLGSGPALGPKTNQKGPALRGLVVWRG